MKHFCSVFILLFFLFPCISSQSRWIIEPGGKIIWTVKENESHTDNIEMSGKYISLIATYGIDEMGRLVLSKQLVFPMLRTIPNDTHGSLIYTFGSEVAPVIKINNRVPAEVIKSFSIKGLIEVLSTVNDNISIVRELFPSTDKPAAVEKYTIENLSPREITVDVEDFEKISRSHKERSFYDIYEIRAASAGSGIFTLKPQQKLSFSVIFSGRRISDPLPEVDAEKELEKRKYFVEQMFNTLVFKSPDPVLNRMFEFSKVRAMESISETKGGLVHSPGGARYYAAIWANDQAEYANPFFAYSGYSSAVEAGMVSWRWFAKYMNPEYKPIPSSIIAEGTDFWNGAGDRGDQAMIAYGASRFALALGDRKSAEEIWPLIEWCLEYCRRKLTADGVVASDSDELEGRFPAGSANLSTSCLFYDALISASYLCKSLGKPSYLSRKYEQMAAELRLAIEKYFGANIEGFNTYRYYDGNDVLRSWICIPLTVGIFDRAWGTLDALFSPQLWTSQGLLTQAGTTTFWDRSTLYGFRGAFAAGATERALRYLKEYSSRRLLGDHVPYAVEAWPEGNQRHLSAESALYCRIVTEGIFGLRPTGFRSFSITPQLPSEWNQMSLEKMKAFGGRNIDIKVERTGPKIRVDVFSDGKMVKSATVINGTKVDVKL